MVIHHDKLAYGKLESMGEDVSEEKLLEMLAEINAEEEMEDCENQDGYKHEKKEKTDDK